MNIACDKNCLLLLQDFLLCKFALHYHSRLLWSSLDLEIMIITCYKTLLLLYNNTGFRGHMMVHTVLSEFSYCIAIPIHCL